jgi:DNA-binding MarR family transcriptional regulator
MTHPKDGSAANKEEGARERPRRTERWRWVGADPDDTAPDADFRRQVAALSREVMLARGADMADVPPLERTVSRGDGSAAGAAASGAAASGAAVSGAAVSGAAASGAAASGARYPRAAAGQDATGSKARPTQPPDYFDICAAASFAVATAFRAVRSEVEAADTATGSLAAGLTLLAVARASRGVTLAHLVAAGDLAQSTVSTIVARLVEGGLVARRRHPADRRRWVFQATNLGLQEAERLAVIWRHLDDRLLGALSVTEREELGRLLRRAAAALAR